MPLPADEHPLTLDPLPAPEVEHLAAYYGRLCAPVDSYVEGHLLEAEHFALLRGERRIGTAAVHGGHMLVHLALEREARRDGRSIFAAVVQHLAITNVMAPTSDEALLTLALDRKRDLRPQGTLFHDAGPSHTPEPTYADFAQRPLTESDTQAVLAMIDDDFLTPKEFEHFQERGGLFVGEIDGQLRSLGVIESPRLLPDHASIGMSVHPDHRRQGLAVDTLVHLKHRCYAEGWKPAAGCAYGNTGSWRSLERAGMIAGTRLLRITLL